MIFTALLARLIRIALKRGIAGRQIFWLALALAGSIIRYFYERDDAIVTRMTAKPGERFNVIVSKPSSRRRLRTSK